MTKRFAALALALLLALPLSGCKNNNEDYIFEYDMTSTPTSLDPQFATQDSAQMILNNVFEGLLVQEASGKLEKIVVALYEAENQRIARWQEREERLKSPELLERLGQLAEENDRLEADFIKELSNTMEGEKGYE